VPLDRQARPQPLLVFGECIDQPPLLLFANSENFNFMHSLAAFFWDPAREIFPFVIPILGRPILWYGFLFALAFFVGYLLLRGLLNGFLNDKAKAHALTERIGLSVSLGALIGARLGDVLFYQSWDQLARDPLSAIKVWEGGLASHGAAAGIAIALFFLARRIKEFSWLRLVDFLVIPVALGAVFIRIGNFMNQEILGHPSNLPWAVLFGHPVDGGAMVPRHPVQLYEALFYLATFLFLWTQRKSIAVVGRLSAFFFLSVFTFRFFIEFVKEEQSALFGGTSLLTMGQYLSVPFIVAGLIVFWEQRKNVVTQLGKLGSSESRGKSKVPLNKSVE
jgi:phosphatidylglycerol:prolipoprotein diacylglycerol transferase